MNNSRKLLMCQSANALIEFALVLPIIIVFLVGIIELSRYTILIQKLDKTTFAMADFVTQGNTVSEANLTGFVQAVPEIMKPFTFDGTIIFSSVLAVSTAPTTNCPTPDVPSCISWQRTRLGSDISRIGSEGGAAILPGAYTLSPGKDVIVAEVYYNYSPLLIGNIAHFIPAFSNHQIYKIAVYRPRVQGLTELAP